MYDLIVQVSGQNLPIYFHKNKLWLFKFDYNNNHGHSLLCMHLIKSAEHTVTNFEIVTSVFASSKKIK